MSPTVAAATKKYEPFPLNEKVVDIIKGMYEIPTTEDACQPHIVRDFFDKAAAMIKTAEVEKEDREIEFNHIKVNISILRPHGSKDKVLPVVIYL
jgi:acetyl esterase